MDLGNYWQENKRFVIAVVLGLITFGLGVLVRNSFYQSDINERRSRITRLKRDLAAPLFTASDRTRAQDENQLLVEAVERLGQEVRFEARPEFLVDPDLGAPANQYLRSLARVRDDLLPLANRANLVLDSGLGMPKLSPTREEEIVRYLEALDVIDMTLRNAIEVGMDSIDRIQIRLDPGLTSRAGLGRIERTRIEFSVTGESEAVTRLLAMTRRTDAAGRSLIVAEVELVPARGREERERLELTLFVARLEPLEEEQA
jgi:hypothetical protein